MASPMDGRSLNLEKDATLRLSRGVLVRVDGGTVLVTREGDPEDHVLQAGDAFLVSGRGLAVAWALTPSVLRVRPAWRRDDSLRAA